MKIEEGLEFNDVVIYPLVGDGRADSRDDVDVSLDLGKFKINFPLVASPMVGVVDANFAKLLSDLGGLAFLHRFYESANEWEKELEIVKSAKNFGVSVGMDYEFEWLLDYNPRIILVDVNNGYTLAVRNYCEKIKSYISKYNFGTMVMGGSVTTLDGAVALKNCGCDIVRYLIGSGSNCSTRNVTGIAIPAVTALAEVKDLDNVYIMVDGGVSNSDVFVKALIAGGDFCMSGRLFAQAFEAPNKGELYGMASRTHMKNMGYKIKSVEGFDAKITKQYSLEQFVEEFSYGIKSAGTFLNATSLKEIAQNGRFVRTGSGSIKHL
jgi:GMP reductase